MENSIKKCPICEQPGIKVDSDPPGTNNLTVTCRVCGKYHTLVRFTHTALTQDKADQSYILSAVLRELQATKAKPIYVDEDNFSDRITHHLVPDLDNPNKKAEKLVQRIKERASHYGQSTQLDWDVDYPLAYAQNGAELKAVVRLMRDSQILDKPQSTLSSAGIVTLTAKGWNLGADLAKQRAESNQAFIAIWFNENMSESTKAIEEAVTESGYDPMCIKDKHYSDKIMEKALNEIRKSKFLIVDLTGSRDSVFFEAGFAYGLGLDIIYVMDKNLLSDENKREFYVTHYKISAYSSPAELKETLINAIGARIT